MTSGKIHSVYVIGILSALLIGSLSVQWSHIADLANIFTFALTFSSLILAIIAIVQTLTSSTQIIHVVSSVSQSSERIKASADSIQLAGDKLIELTSLIPGRFDDVAKRLDLQNEAIRQMSEVNRPSRKMEAAASGDIGDVSDKDQIEFSDLTVGATLALYTALKAFKAQRPFSFEEVFPNYRTAWSYGKGFLVGLRCTHRLKYTIIKTGNIIPRYTVTEVSRIDIDGIISKTEASENDYYSARVPLVQTFFESSDGDS